MAPSRQAPFMINGIPALRFGDGIALLDVADDLYSCLYDPDGQEGASLVPDSRGIAMPDIGTPSPTMIRRRWQDLPNADARPRLRDIPHFISALVVAAIRYRRRNFNRLLDTDIVGRSAGAAISNDDMAILVTRFEHMSLLLPFPMLCLFRSFFLLHFLARYGQTAEWVFGVTLFPFRAHCWLATGDLLIGETSQRAAQFSPILIVEAGHP